MLRRIIFCTRRIKTAFESAGRGRGSQEKSLKNNLLPFPFRTTEKLVTNRPQMLHLLHSQRFCATFRHWVVLTGLHWLHGRASRDAQAFARSATEADHEGEAHSSVTLPTVVHRQRVLGKPAPELGLQVISFVPFSFPTQRFDLLEPHRRRRSIEFLEQRFRLAI